jgi:hypothetical protein
MGNVPRPHYDALLHGDAMSRVLPHVGWGSGLASRACPHGDAMSRVLAHGDAMSDVLPYVVDRALCLSGLAFCDSIAPANSCINGCCLM